MATSSSPLQRVNPAVKIAVLGVGAATVPALVGHWQVQLLLLAGLASAGLACRVPLRRTRAFAPALGVIGLSVLSWLVFDRDGPVAVTLPALGWSVHVDAIDQALTSGLRALNWVAAYALLLLTTPNRDLVAGLRQLRVPHAAATAVGMTLRFWGLVAAGTRQVMDAQRARGVDLDGRTGLLGLRRRVLLVAVPSIFLLLRRFRTLSQALALRGFGAPGPKTRWYRPPLRPVELVGAAVAAVVLGAAVALDRVALPA